VGSLGQAWVMQAAVQPAVQPAVQAAVHRLWFGGARRNRETAAALTGLDRVARFPSEWLCGCVAVAAEVDFRGRYFGAACQRLRRGIPPRSTPDQRWVRAARCRLKRVR